MGILVALDDFGTGHASLTHLIEFPVDAIKIDKSFVDGIENGGPARVIAASLIDIAGQLHMRLIAEGIETTGQLAALRELGCVLGQGYGLSRPEGFAETSSRLMLQGSVRSMNAAQPSQVVASDWIGQVAADPSRRRPRQITR